MKTISVFTFLLLFTLYIYTGSAFAGFEGGSNTFYGSGAGANAGDDDYCTFIGRSAGNSNTTGASNTFLGLEAATPTPPGTSTHSSGVVPQQQHHRERQHLPRAGCRAPTTPPGSTTPSSGRVPATATPPGTTTPS